jgi:UDP-N-acetylmuramoyl-tripeptide--D-alanyl-D-alanine ligase
MTLVDDTYNSNPSSLKAALNSLRDLGLDGGRMLVGLGEMMELGDETEPAHLEAGGMVAELGPEYFVAMGKHAGEMIRGAVAKGYPPERAAVAKSHREMAQIIRDVMKNGDLLLLKGSRKACLEKVTEILKEGASREV